MTTDVLPLWRCTTREPLEKLHRGRQVVIGDVAHPVNPHLALGTVSAIEDAGVLGALFEDVPSVGDLESHIPQRLALFDKLRVGRVAAYKYYSDVPFFRNAVEAQRENCERFLKPKELPSKYSLPGFICGEVGSNVGGAETVVHEFRRCQRCKSCSRGSCADQCRFEMDSFTWLSISSGTDNRRWSALSKVS